MSPSHQPALHGMSRAALGLVVALGLAPTCAAAGEARQQPSPQAGPQPKATFRVEHAGERRRVELERLPDGRLMYRVEDLGGRTLSLSPEEFAEWTLRPREDGQWIARILNISSPAGFAWVLLGLLGQALFTGRMLIQWFASEREKRSVVPTAFWWMSLGGALMLVVYFLWRRDVVGVLGQSTGCFIYLRNLRLIYRRQE